MLIINVENNNIEKALKVFKYKVNKTKQTKILRDQKEFVKPSVIKRKQIQKARYIEQKFNNTNNLD